MKYMGSKNRIAKYIVPIINKFNDRTYYVEPFVGGANIIDKVDYEVRKGFDKNVYLVDLLDYVAKQNKLPESISEEEYYKVRDNKSNYPNWYVGLVGFCASYGGRFFEGYPRGLKTDGTPRDYTNEAIRNLKKQQPNLKGIIFKDTECDYSDIDCSEVPTTIYCDPPYAGSKPYKTGLLGHFDSNKFWEWARWQSEYNPVLISEYNAPDDFICLWEQEVISNLKGKGSKKSVEKLFINELWIHELKK